MKRIWKRYRVTRAADRAEHEETVVQDNEYESDETLPRGQRALDPVHNGSDR